MVDQNQFPLDDIDPETNFLPFHSCKYYSDESLRELNSLNVENFSLFHVNVRSMAKNGETLSHYLTETESKFSVIALTETWLTPSNSSLYELPDYNHVCLLRNRRRGGGVSIHLTDSLIYKERPDLNVMTDDCEILFVEIKIETKSYLVGVIYRPPSGNVADFLEQLTTTLCKLNSVPSTCYVCGDFNLDLTLSDQHSMVQTFLDLFHSSSFIPLIDKPTRVTSESASLIDNIFTNSLLDSHSAGILVADISDHYPVFCFSESMKSDQGSKTVVFRPFTEANKQAFREAIISTNMNSVLLESNAQQAFTVFAKIVSDAFQGCFPLKHRPPNRTDAHPWLTRGIRKSIKVKNKLYLRFRNRPNAFNEVNYKRYRYALDRIIAQAKKDHYQKRITENRRDIKKTWQILKEVIGNKKGKTSIQSIMINDVNCTDPTRIAEEFNAYFVNVGSELERQIPVSTVDPGTYLRGNYRDSIFLIPVTPLEVFTSIQRQKNSSAGHDYLQPSIVKLISDVIADPLAHVINLCFEQSIFPNELKIANVLPIHKGGDPSNVQNYRPISMLPFFSKVFERLLYNRLYDFLSQRGVIADSQFGFRKKFSTEMALAFATDRITNEIDKGNCVVGLFLDLKKAFDTVHHRILEQKLFHYGIRGDALNLVRNYLHNRNQAVKISQHVSTLKSYHFGVPQGSILGPLFFLIYINDLRNCLTSTFPVLYADDTNIFMSGSDIEEMTRLFNNDLAYLTDWLKSNRLSLNLSKTHSMIFSTNRTIRDQTLSLFMNGTVISTTKTTTFLGLKIDNALSWSTHIAHVAGKISKSVGILKKASRVLTSDTLLSLYKSLVLPYLHYCNLIWGNAPNVHLQRLVVLQKRAIRIINKIGPRDHTSPYFAQDNLLTVPDIYKLSCSIFLYKLKFHVYPLFFVEYFNNILFPDGGLQLRDRTASRSVLRGLARPLRCRTSMRQKTFANQSIQMFNTIVMPYDLFETSQSLNSFKKAVIAILIAARV